MTESIKQTNDGIKARLNKILPTISKLSLSDLYQIIAMQAEEKDSKDLRIKELEAERNHAVHKFEEVAAAYVNKVLFTQAVIEKAKEAMKETRCINGYYPSCQNSQAERDKHAPYVNYGERIVPCVRCEALQSINDYQSGKGRE